MDDEGFEDQLPDDLGQVTDALGEGQAGRPRRRMRRPSPRRTFAIILSLTFAVTGGGALAAVAAGSGVGSPLKLISQEFGSVFRSTSMRDSAAAIVYCGEGTNQPAGCTPQPMSTVKSQTVSKKKPLRCKKGKVKRTKKVHGKKVIVCVPKKKKHVKAVHVGRKPTFTG